MKRSVSPLSGQNSDTNPKKKRLISVFSAIKDVFLKLNGSSSGFPPSKTSQFENNASDEEELPNSFVSRKRRMSIHDTNRRLSLAIPRSSVSGPTGKGMLESLYDSVKTKQENNDVDGEFTRLGNNPEEQLAKEFSPSVQVPKNQVLPKIIQREQFSGESDLELEENPQPLILEQDYAPLYEDDEGNLVRPPFINLDPRERYHMLQMKKSMETSEFLQSRLKYMVDPDETTSIYRPNNKVDSATQTYTKDYLDKSLNFNALRTKLALKNRRQRKTKKGLGVFSGEFYYEPTEAEAPSNTDLKFQGVLGSVNKPQFAEKTVKNADKVLPDAESRQNPLKRRGSVSQRPGLEDTLRFGKKQESLDEDYVLKVANTSNIIKLKDQPSERKSVSIGPSAAFKFDIQKDKISSILDQKKPEIDLKKPGNEEKNSAAAPSAPSSSLFGSQSNKESTNDTESSNKPGMFGSTKPFSFGSKTDTSSSDPADKPEKPAPSFSFGSKPQEKQSGLFGDSKKSDDSQSKAPAFSFGTSKGEEKSKAPAFSFGGSKDKEETKAPAFSFGSSGKSAETKKPAFTFGGSDAKTGEKPSISFTGSSSDLGSKPPAFSFGTTEKKEETKTPAFSFGGENKPTESKTPVFSFGKTESNKQLDDSKASNDNAIGGGSEKSAPSSSIPASIFGKPATEASQANSVPKFSFGSTPKPSGTSEDESEEPQVKRKAPASSSTPLFGNSGSTAKPSEKDDQASTQTSGFGSKPSLFGTKPDASKTDAKESTSDEPQGSQAPKFSFGKTAETTTEAPKFSFGKTADTGTEAPKFSFGKSTDTGAEAPKFSFGKTSAPAKDTPSFSFGSTEKPKELGTPETASETKDASKPSFPGAKPPTTGFLFGSSTNSASFGGNQPSSSEPTPAPSFSFSNPKPAQGTPASAPAFNFGQSATADPAQIFGGGGNAPAPSFNFSMTPKPASTSASIPQPGAFGAAANAAPGFNFSSNTIPAFGGSRPATPGNSAFGFGADSQNGAQAPAPAFGGFNNATAPSSVFGGTSRSATPSFGGFGQTQPTQFNNSQPQPNGFSFSNNAIGGATINSAPGSFGQPSREGTPPAFGNPIAGVPQAGPNFTGRKIAQMRLRRR